MGEPGSETLPPDGEGPTANADVAGAAVAETVEGAASQDVTAQAAEVGPVAEAAPAAEAAGSTETADGAGTVKEGDGSEALPDGQLAAAEGDGADAVAESGAEARNETGGEADAEDEKADQGADPEPAYANMPRIEDIIDEALLAELREAFLLVKHPGDEDQIDSSQILPALRSLGIGLAPREHTELVAAADPGGSGQIPWKVFLALAAHLAHGRNSQTHEAEELLEAFRAADRDGSGRVTFRECQKAANGGDHFEAQRHALLLALKSEENPGYVNYEDFVRQYVTERRWHSSYMEGGGLATTQMEGAELLTTQ